MDLSDIRFGVASHSDYPSYYSYCGYANAYGDPSDGNFPYNLDMPLTYDTASVRSTINSLYIREGWDGPEDYARVLWEMLNDPAIGWRSSCANPTPAIFIYGHGSRKGRNSGNLNNIT
jgi:hypothetical protein